MGIQRCFECGHSSNTWDMKKVVRHYEGKGYKFSLEVNLPHCEKCGKVLYDSQLEEVIRRKANKIMRDQLDK